MSRFQQDPASRASSTRLGKAMQSTILRYFACYLLFLVVLVFCLVNFFLWDQVVTQSIQIFLTWTGVVEMGYYIVVTIVGLILLVVAIMSERSLRASVPELELRATFARIAVRLLIAAFVALGIFAFNGLLFPAQV